MLSCLKCRKSFLITFNLHEWLHHFFFNEAGDSRSAIIRASVQEATGDPGTDCSIFLCSIPR